MKKSVDKKSTLAIVSLVLGLVSLIPLIGFFVGFITIIISIVALVKIKKNNLGGKGLAIAGLILGIIGMLFTIAMYGSLFYILLYPQEGGAITEGRIELSKQLLQQTAGSLELYLKEYGNYPANLEELTEAGYTYFPSDHFGNFIQYNLSEDGLSYELRTAGVDKELGTADDIVL